MIRFACLLASMLALSGCSIGIPSGAYSVAEVIERMPELDGQKVAVYGFLAQCGGNDCGLYSSEEDAEIVENGDYETTEWSAAMDRRLSIGAADGFDITASFMQYQKVTIEGRVNSYWKFPVPTEDGTTSGCFDRCNDIDPTSIKRIIF